MKHGVDDKVYERFKRDRLKNFIEWIEQEKVKEIFDDLEKEKYANPCMKCGSVLCSICSDDIKEVKQKHLGKTKEAKDEKS